MEQPRTRQTMIIIAGSIVYALALSLSTEIANLWLRMLVAALGGAILGSAIVLARRPPGS